MEKMNQQQMTLKASATDNNMLYPLDASPPPGQSLLLASQWLFLMIPLCVIPASVLGYAFGLTTGEQAMYLQRILILTGFMTATQALVGNRLTLVCGPATVLIVGYLAAGGGDIYGFSGAMIMGGALLALLGATGMLRRLLGLFTPNVVAVILILVAVSLIPVLTKMAAGMTMSDPSGQPEILIRSVALAMLIVFMSQYLPGFSRPLAILIGIIIGIAVNLTLGLKMSPSAAPNISWLSFPLPIGFSGSHYSLSVLLPFLFCYLALAVNEVGSVQGMGNLLQVKDLDRRQDRSFITTGAANLVCGLFGTIGLVSYSLSPGVVSVTRVASRHVLMLGACLLFLFGLSPRLTYFFSLIPVEVVGAAMLAILGTQIGAGVAILIRKGDFTARDYMVVGFPVMLGGLISFLPQDFFMQWPVTLRTLLSNSMVVGVLTVLILEHGLRGRRV
jgi:xanthine/uracil permease